MLAGAIPRGARRQGGGGARAQGDKALEDQKVAGAIRTDFILSAEIMAIALATITAPDLLTQAIVLAAVAIFITAAVYGVVALIVRADDLGARLAVRNGAISGRGRARAAARHAAVSGSAEPRRHAGHAVGGRRHSRARPRRVRRDGARAYHPWAIGGRCAMRCRSMPTCSPGWYQR